MKNHKKRFHKSRTARTWGSLLLIAGLLLSFTVSPATFQTPVEALEDRSEEFESSIESLRHQLEETQKEIQEIQAQAQGWKQRISEMELENEALVAEKNQILKQIEEAEQTLLARQKEQKEAEEQVLRKQEEYQKRVAAMFYFRRRSPWEIVLSAKGLEGFFTNLRMISAITTSDANMLRDLKYAEEVKRAATEVALKTREAFEDFLAEKEAQLAELQEGILHAQEESARLNELLTNRSLEMENAEQDLQAKEAAYQAYKVALQNYAGQIAALTPAGSGAVWPLPVSNQISSPYGYRTLGIDASNGYMHTGTDFAGPNVAGAPVVAAWEGIVVTVHQPYPGQMFAPDANYVQISHGGGLGTGYWHLMSCAVVPGQHVAQGQIIGYCGSTGFSTGPHLHFEVYNETSTAPRNTVDPMLYLGG